MNPNQKSGFLKGISPLADAAMPFLSLLDPRQVFDGIAENACWLSGADACSFCIYDKREKKFFLKALHNLKGPVELSNVLYRRTWRSIKHIGDLKAFLLKAGKENLVKWADRKRFASMIYVPISDSRGICGALNLYYRFPPNRLVPEEKELLSAFARCCGIAIENARSHQDTAERMEESSTLYDVGRRLISTLDIGEILDEVLQVAQDRFDYPNCSVLLLDDTGEELYIKTARGYPKDLSQRVTPRVGEGVTGWVAKTGQPLLVPDVRKDPRYISGMKGARSELCVPMKIGNRIIGVLDAESKEPDGFTDRDVRILSSLALQASLVIDNARLYQGLERRVRELDLLNQIANYISAGLSFEETLNHIADGIKKLIDYHSGRIYLVDRSRQVLVPTVIRYETKEYPYPYTQFVKKIEMKMGEGLTGWVAQTGQPVVVGDAEHHPRVKHIPGAPYRDESLLAVPLVSDGKVMGVIALAKLGLNQFGPNELRLLTILANQAAIAIENARLYEETKHLTNIDPLTGLYNSRYFYDTLEKEIAKAHRYGGIVSLVMMDVDNFKWCNDNFGHQVGDAVLSELGQILLGLSRKADTAVRYGGEEFAIILPHTPRKGAVTQAERIRSKVETYPFYFGEAALKDRITITAGVAACPEDGKAPKTLLHSADMALYQAKAAGKNKVAAFSRRKRKGTPKPPSSQEKSS